MVRCLVYSIRMVIVKTNYPAKPSPHHRRGRWGACRGSQSSSWGKDVRLCIQIVSAWLRVRGLWGVHTPRRCRALAVLRLLELLRACSCVSRGDQDFLGLFCNRCLLAPLTSGRGCSGSFPCMQLHQQAETVFSNSNILISVSCPRSRLVGAVVVILSQRLDVPGKSVCTFAVCCLTRAVYTTQFNAVMHMHTQV